MNRADRIRWDRKYGKKVPSEEITPDPFLARNLHRISGGQALH